MPTRLDNDRMRHPGIKPVEVSKDGRNGGSLVQEVLERHPVGSEMEMQRIITGKDGSYILVTYGGRQRGAVIRF